MPDSKTELLRALKDAREYASYLSELGIETLSYLEDHASASEITTAPAKAPAKTMSMGGSSQPGIDQSIRQPISTSISTITKLGAAVQTPQSSLFGEALAELPGLPQSSETLDDIWRDIGECTRCGLCEARTQVVNTHGNRNARLMFIGEAPGAEEDAQGKPFVGRAGQLLTKIIEAIGLKREDVIIGNVNRCRPPGNRQPTLEEAAICRPFLFREIAAVRPAVIVVMGNTALRNLLEIREGITRVRGQFQDFQGIKVMPTFHPAYLLRDPSKKRETWEDMKKVREYLDSLETNRSIY